ncbi:phosphatidylserine/phosphatidylglycerophosphate/cardiolipin synthase family protein [Sagittula sp. MA-2]|jgi:phospholipase D1/2|uniref:phospholipase D-like domain-containing protein n=1 Tax=Sagittula sp. MA-2 TaxID=3048007 RepID=UPI0024C37D75|nr:phospholipase D-like domain-containing protein [Sagittula sp. MA-2]WHZ34832.1 phospholipase D-like domain-containing protein [Sagittula sp. MA-2]
MTRLLHTRSETLAALETLAASATEELILAVRTLSPGTPLLTEALTERGLNTWSDLIAWVTRRGVRLLMAFGDDDPLFDADRHRRVWLAASAFANVHQGNAQIFCAPHGQTIGRLWTLRFRRPIRAALRQLATDDARRLTLPQRAALAKGPTPRPQRIAQSFAVADGERALIGGYSIDMRHKGQDWHDVAALIEDADFAGALRSHFADCWSAAIATGAPTLASEPRPFATVSRRQSRPELRLLRTLSDPSSGPLAFTGTTKARDAETHLLRTFGAARQHVFIETPAFRHPALADALASAARATPELQLTVVLHPDADILPFGGALPDTVARAEDARDHTLALLARAFGRQATFLKHAPQGRDTVAQRGPDGTAGRVIVVDGTTIVLGSHSLTLRSMRLDTEASVLIRDTCLAQDLVAQRARKWLGPEADNKDPTRAETWATAPAPLETFKPQAPAPRRTRPMRLPDKAF